MTVLVFGDAANAKAVLSTIVAHATLRRKLSRLFLFCKPLFFKMLR